MLEKVETATVDRRTMQYLYNDGSNFVFMDVQTYDQTEVTPEIVGDAANFMLENTEAIVATNEGRVLFIEIPASAGVQGPGETTSRSASRSSSSSTVALSLRTTSSSAPSSPRY